MWSVFKLLAVTLATVAALPQPEIYSKGTSANSVDAASVGLDFTGRSLSSKECSGGIFSSTCLKIEALSMIEKLSTKDELSLLPGISVVKESRTTNDSNAEQVAAELARSLPDKMDERLDKYLIYRLGDYLDSHSVRFRLLDENSAREAKSAIGEARKKIGGKKGGLGTLLAAGLMMKGTLMSIGMGALALLAGKALMTALMSLLLSAVIGLKALTSGGGKSTTYEIVSKPIYSHSHSHSTAHEDGGHYGHSGYGRSYDGIIKRR